MFIQPEAFVFIITIFALPATWLEAAATPWNRWWWSGCSSCSGFCHRPFCLCSRSTCQSITRVRRRKTETEEHDDDEDLRSDDDSLPFKGLMMRFLWLPESNTRSFSSLKELRVSCVSIKKNHFWPLRLSYSCFLHFLFACPLMFSCSSGWAAALWHREC